MGFYESAEFAEASKLAMEFYQSAKFKAWVIIPKITGTLSIVGSSLIIRDVLRKENHRRKLKATTNRIVSLMSICDVIASFIGSFLGTWLVPKEVGVWSAAGNQGTCTFQGFVTNFFGGAAISLNATLAVTYVLIVCFVWKDERLQKYFTSFLLLGFPVLVSLGLTLWPLIDQAFNWTGAMTCSVGPGPWFCAFTGAPCVTGNQGRLIRLVFMIFVQIDFAVIFISTVALYWTVLQKERATDRYAVNECQRNRKQSKKVAMQGIWYAGSFFLTHIFWWIITIYEFATRKTVPYWLNTTSAIFMPLQGFFNAIVYFRPRLISRKNREGRNLGSLLGQSPLVRRAFGIFNFSNFTKASDTRIRRTATTGLSSGNVPSLASAAGNRMEQPKDEEDNWDEEAPVVNVGQ